MNVFHLSPKTVKQRLDDIQRVPELRIHLTNPRLMHLLVHHNRAQSRLSFLQEVDLKCACFHKLSMCCFILYNCLTDFILTGTDSEDLFESYIKEGKDENIPMESIAFIQRLLGSSDEAIEKNLKLHPLYLKVPLTQINETYAHLRSLKYKNEHLMKVVQILLYPKYILLSRSFFGD